MCLLCWLVRGAFRRSFPRARQGFFFVSYAAAGAASLRQRNTRTGDDDEPRTEQGCHYPMSGNGFHNDRPSNELLGIAILPAGSVGTDGTDDAARAASLAALVNRRIFGFLDVLALYQRP